MSRAGEIRWLCTFILLTIIQNCQPRKIYWTDSYSCFDLLNEVDATEILNIKLPDRDDNTIYYRCIFGNKILFTCPDGMHFIPKSNVCDDANNSKKHPKNKPHSNADDESPEQEKKPDEGTHEQEQVTKHEEETNTDKIVNQSDEENNEPEEEKKHEEETDGDKAANEKDSQKSESELDDTSDSEAKSEPDDTSDSESKSEPDDTCDSESKSEPGDTSDSEAKSDDNDENIIKEQENKKGTDDDVDNKSPDDEKETQTDDSNKEENVESNNENEKTQKAEDDEKKAQENKDKENDNAEDAKKKVQDNKDKGINDKLPVEDMTYNETLSSKGAIVSESKIINGLDGARTRVEISGNQTDPPKNQANNTKKPVHTDGIGIGNLVRGIGNVLSSV